MSEQDCSLSDLRLRHQRRREIARLILARRRAYLALWEAAQDPDSVRWNALREAAREAGEAELDAIQTPTLILHGRDDRVLPLELAIRLHRAIKQSQMHTFGNCGHWVQIERRDEFVAQVLAFVKAAS